MGNLLDKVDSINYLNITAVARKVEDSSKATKFSFGVGKDGAIYTLPNGGTDMSKNYLSYTNLFYKNPFSAKSERQQLPWTTTDISNLTYLLEQNTDTKEIRVTQYIVQINAQVRPPSIAITSYPSTIPWGHNVTIQGTTSDTSSSDTISISWGDGSSNTNISATPTWSATHVYSSANVGVKTVTATLTSGQFSASATANIDVKKHNTSLSAPILSTNSVLWGNIFQASPGTLTDSDAGGCVIAADCPNSITRSLNYSGTAVDSSNGVPSGTSSVNITASQNIGTGKTVIASFSEDNYYLSSSSQASLIQILKHHTSIINFVTAGEWFSTSNPFNVIGKLVDNDRANIGVDDKTISFSGSGAAGLTNTKTGGVTIESTSNIEVLTCGYCNIGSGDNAVVLEAGDKIKFDVPVTTATLFFETDQFVTLTSTNGITHVDDFDGTQNTGFYRVYGPNVSEITIDSISGNSGKINLSRITASNQESNLLTIDADLSVLQNSAKTIHIAGGTFSKSGQAPSSPGSYVVTANFSEDSLYLGSSASDSFNLEANQNILTQSGTGALANVVADSGVGYVGTVCSTDSDNDALCNGWENSGANFGVDGKTYYLLLPDRSTNTKNLFIEIDYMKDHKPDQTAIDNLKSVFLQNGIILTVFVDEELPHVDMLNIWTDNDLDPTNDFDSIKANHFGPVSERPSATGQTNSITTKTTTTKDLVVSGITVTTPPHSSRVLKDPAAADNLTQGVITIKSKIITSADVTLSVPSTITKPVPGGGLTIISNPTVSVLPIPGKEHIVTIQVSYKTSGALTNISLGTLTVPITLSSGATATPATYPNSPFASSTLSSVYAQMVRYMVYAHSSGGPSATAEFLGNDAAITLGQGFGGSVSGHTGSIGTTREQSGTMMHEIGHWLGLKHGGPEKIGTTVVPDADINCNPLNTGVMPYSRQTPAYLGPSWNLDYSHGTLTSIDENSLLETKGFLSTSATTTQVFTVGTTPVVKKASSYSSGQTVVKVNFDNDGVFDTSPVKIDLNNFGIPGCNSPGFSIFNDYDEWANLKFNFRDTVSGQFDGAGSIYHPTPNGDLNYVNYNLQNFQGFQFFGAVSPPQDGSGMATTSSTLPLKIPIFTSDGKKITSATMFAQYSKDGTTWKDAMDNQKPANKYFSYSTSDGFFVLNWKIPKTTPPGVYYIIVYVVDPATGANIPVINESLFPNNYISPNNVIPVTLKITIS